MSKPEDNHHLVTALFAVSDDTDSGFILRAASIDDVPIIVRCIKELAAYEGLAHECMATEALVCEWLFGTKRSAEVTLAYDGEQPAGFALWFRNYSTFLCRPGIYLEDLFVFEQFRGRGLGRILLSHLAATAQKRGYGRVEWGVLNWNTDAIGFYDAIGARPVTEWTTYRLDGTALASLATKRNPGDSPQ